MVITDEYTTADSHETVDVIAQKLRNLLAESDGGTVLISHDDKVVGYVTTKEMINLIATGKNFSKKSANEIMSTDFMNVFEDDTLGDIIPKISEKYPNAVVVLNSERKCVGFFSKNDYKEALAGLGVYDKSREPKTKDEWTTRGIAMSSLGNKDEAVKSFSKSVEGSDNKEQGWSNLAKRLEKLNRLKDAIVCYDKVLTINENNDEALTAKGNIYSEEETDTLAIQSFKQALELNPNNSFAMMSLSTEQANIGEVDEAIETLDKAAKIDGETPEIWFRKGNIYDKAKKLEDALECYNKATGLNDFYEEAWFSKGIILNRLGRNNDALQCLIKILQINPGNESARRALNANKEKGPENMFEVA
jgi:tetratricopeptide (TPR) repeat protein